MFVNTSYRSNKTELMDDLELKGELLRDTLDKIALINKHLGGNVVILDGLKKLLNGFDKSQTIKIIDLGCGNGDMLREIAMYGRKTNRKFELYGIDANTFTIDYAEELSNSFHEISYRKINIFSEAFDLLKYDIALASLFIHHFKK